jgi:SAM-dependent methyltransferase
MKRAANSTWYNWYANDLLARDVEALTRGLSGDVVVDVGSGTSPYRGFVSAFRHYVGVDRPGRPDSGSHPDVFGAAAALPLRDAVADAVLCTEVIEHVPDPGALVAESARVLKPGGALVLSAPFTWHLHDEPHDYWRFTEYGLRLLCERAGLRVIAVRATNRYFGAVLQSRAYWWFFVSGRLRPLVRPVVWFMQVVAAAAAPLDRNPRMASNYVLLAKKAE